MANITAVKLFRTDLGDDLTVLASQIDAWLIATGDMTILNVAVLRRTLQSRANDLRIAITYQRGPAGTTRGMAMRVRAFTADSVNQSSEGEMAAFFALGVVGIGRPTPYFVVDVSERAAGAGFNSAYLAFFTNFNARRCFGDARQTFFAVPVIDIAPGADSTASTQIYDSFNQRCLGSAIVRNVSLQTWTAGEYNYAVCCPLTGRWLGSAPCQVAAPVTAPLPAYRAGPFPRVGGVTPADEASMDVAYRALPYTPVP